MAKKRNKTKPTQSHNREYKRQIKLINQQLNIFGIRAIQIIIDEELPLKSDKAGEVFEKHSKQYRAWVKEFVRKKKMKLTVPILEAFDNNILTYIEQQLNPKKDEDKIEDKIEADGEPSSN